MARLRLPKPVVAFGSVSLLNDLSSEMIYPLLPLFLKGLGASVAFIGVIEGIAETAASLLKLFSGWLADRFGRHRALALAGYVLASLTRPLLAFASAPWQVLVLRFVDRVGKGIRTAPRDALIAHVSDAEARATAFGFHRMMDNLGASLGPLLASAILLLAPENYRLVFLLASMPALISLWVFHIGVPRVAVPVQSQRQHPLTGARALLKGRFGWFLVCVLLFTLGNSSDAFLLLRAEQAGMPHAWVPILWAGLNTGRTLLATPCGMLADLLGRERVLLMGWLLYAGVYAGFAFAGSLWQIVALFGGYACYYGLVEGTERALVADFAPESVRGQAYGLFHFVVGAGMLPASVLFGALWEWAGVEVAFLTGAGLALMASALFWLSVRRA
ncbi:Predicted arabinose efflux permease, MFS family [Armatimonadetes bacterium GBS]|jgi:MFS family permease|nr:MAG: MFS transporter [Fimbriimonadales bacterium]CUU10994.1 Predicted arabinose efflux permease, MFS family [Armatimonadetes bacterium GBS]CUU33796.1 Predicted arabinose efflux permease, MFS family [Armatimonadetes bacterium GXS]